VAPEAHHHRIESIEFALGGGEGPGAMDKVAGGERLKNTVGSNGRQTPWEQARGAPAAQRSNNEKTTQRNN